MDSEEKKEIKRLVNVANNYLGYKYQDMDKISKIEKYERCIVELRDSLLNIYRESEVR